MSDQHYLVVSGEEYTYIQHSNGCPTEEIGNDDGKYIMYRCEVASHDDGLDLDDYFETKKLGPGKYPIEAWSGRNWTDYGWEYDGGLVFSATPQDSTAYYEKDYTKPLATDQSISTATKDSAPTIERKQE